MYTKSTVTFEIDEERNVIIVLDADGSKLDMTFDEYREWRQQLLHDGLEYMEEEVYINEDQTGRQR